MVRPPVDPYGRWMHDTRPRRAPLTGWGVVTALGCLMVGAYDLIASAMARVTFFGTEVSPEQLADAHRLSTAAALAVAAIPFAVAFDLAIATGLTRGAAERDRPPPTTVALWLGWVFSFVGAVEVSQRLPNAMKPVGFGVLWGIGGAVLTPLVIAAVVMATWRRPRASDAGPTPQLVDRDETEDDVDAGG